ncbi:unnamed protein product [Rhodiola kirilowii]
MTALGWNCRGLGGAATVRALRDMVRANNPLVVGLMETKAGKRRMEFVRMEVGFQNGFVMESKGRAGGLALCWRDKIDLRICSFSDFHIDAVIEGKEAFRVTIFYGHPVTHKRAKSWDLIRTLNSMMDRPWIIFGDFNEVLFGWEVKGRIVRGEWQMKKFRQVLQDCDLSDIGFRGSQFTFSNKRKGLLETKARLDRVLANGTWRTTFPNAEVVHGVSGCSDHSPLIINWKPRKCRMSRLKLFRFEPMWLRHNGYAEMVKDVWEDRVVNSEKLMDGLAACAEGMKSWNDRHFGKIRERVNNLQKEQSQIQDAIRTEEVIDQEVKITNELDEWFLREELLWKQRSRADWLKEGDRNTRFFHQRASNRRKTNRIEKLKIGEDDWIYKEEEISEHIVRYFASIFSSSRDGSTSQLSEWIQAVPKKVTKEMEMELTRPYTESEV